MLHMSTDRKRNVKSLLKRSGAIDTVFAWFGDNVPLCRRCQDVGAQVM